MDEQAPYRPVVYQPGETKDITVRRDLVYRTINSQKLLMDLYLPSRLEHPQRAPIVLFIHGGPIPPERRPSLKDWEMFRSYGALVAGMGMAGVMINHRYYATDHLHQSVSDIKTAIAYLQTHAASFGIDPDRLGVWAFSGGGLLLSWFLKDRPAFARCLVAFYGVLGLEPFADEFPGENGRALMQSFSPVRYLRESPPSLPIFVARAGRDKPEINQTIDRFIQEALAANLMLDVANHPSGEHGFDVWCDDQRSRAIIARALAFVQTSLLGG
jgi:acetyl esterase/lipase